LIIYSFIKLSFSSYLLHLRIGATLIGVIDVRCHDIMEINRCARVEISWY